MDDLQSQVQRAMKLMQGMGYKPKEDFDRAPPETILQLQEKGPESLSQEPQPAITAPVQEVPSDLDDQVKRAMVLMQGMGYKPKAMEEMHDVPIEAPTNDLSLKEKALHVIRGGAEDLGGQLDLASKISSKMGYGHPLMAPYEDIDRVETPETHFGQSAGKLVDEISGTDLGSQPQGKAYQDVGRFMAPNFLIPGVGGYASSAAKGVKALAKNLGREAVMATGASTALNATPEIFEEGTGARLAEDIGKSMIGGSAALKAPGLLKSLTKPVQSTKNVLAKGASRFLTPDESFLAKAAKHDIEVPLNVGAHSGPANFVANNYLKTMFSSKKYNDFLKNSDESVIKAVKKHIDELGTTDLKPHEASSLYAQALKEDEKVLRKKSSKRYAQAEKMLDKSEAIVPKNTIKSLQSGPVRDLLSNLSPSSSQKKVMDRIKDISDKLIPSEKDLPASFLKSHGHNEKLVKAALKSLKSSKNVNAKDLINLRKSLLETLHYEPDIRGSEAFLSRIVKDLDKDISRIPNTGFLEKHREANQFFKENIGQRFRKDLAISVMKGESPRDAFNLMNSVDNIKQFQKISGETDRGKELFNALKKAKVRDIMKSSVEGGLESGNIKNASFSNLFKKGEGRNELLQELLGKKSYDNLSEIAEVADQFAKDGRQLLNTSGTAHVASDLNASKEVAKQVTKNLAYIFGTAAGGYSAAGLTGAIGAVGAPYVVSNLMSDPKFINAARAYAIARKNGQEKYANTLLKKLVPMTNAAIKSGSLGKYLEKEPEKKEERKP